MIVAKQFGEIYYGCDVCGAEGPPTVHFQEKDFDICLWCISDLFWENIEDIKEYYQCSGKNIKVIDRTIYIRGKIPEELRNRIYKRDDYKCVKCGEKEDLTLDHIIPFIKGGPTKRNNLQTLCRRCNSLKHTKRELNA